MKSRILLLLFLCGLMNVTVMAQTTQPTGLQLYDAFDRSFIDPTKWSSVWQCGPPALECVREIQDHQLHLRVRAYGSSDSNSGTQFGSSAVNLTSSSVTDISTQVVVRASRAQDCSTNSGVAHSQVLLYGAFFNGGGGTAADDVQAYLQFDRGSADVTGTVDVGGFLQYQGQFFGNVDLGPVNLGERVIVELRWDQANHQFLLRLFRPSVGISATQVIPYAIPDTVAAVAPFKSLSANVFPANCVGSTTASDLDVNFDMVKTN